MGNSFRNMVDLGVEGIENHVTSVKFGNEFRVDGSNINTPRWGAKATGNYKRLNQP